MGRLIVAGYLFIVLAVLIMEFGQTYLMQRTGQKAMFDLRRDLMAHFRDSTYGSMTAIPSAVLSRASQPMLMSSTNSSAPAW